MKPQVSAIKENIKFVRDFMDKENIKYDIIYLTPTGFVCDVRGYSVTFRVQIELEKFTNIRDSKIKYRIGRWKNRLKISLFIYRIFAKPQNY